MNFDVLSTVSALQLLRDKRLHLHAFVTVSPVLAALSQL